MADALTVEEIRALPAAVPLVDAGKAFGLGRTLSHELARSGEFPVPLLRLGTRYRAKRADILAELGIDDTDDSDARARGAANPTNPIKAVSRPRRGRPTSPRTRPRPNDRSPTMTTIAPQRRFPTDAEVDQWLDAHLVDETDSSPLVDQLKAAVNDTSGRIRGAAPHLVASGKARWALLDGEPRGAIGHEHLRGAARQYMAAESAGITPLCPHTRQARPIVIHCDPPVAYCADCHSPEVEAAMQAIGHLWNHRCDRCGAHAERLTPVTLSGLGHYLIVGHVCPRCAAHDRRQAAQLADHVQIVGRRHPCPCGSGRRFKNCCARRAVR